MIYIDEPKFGNYNWCHMMTDGDIHELHQFAYKIGLRRKWFQDGPLHPHYDLHPTKRKLAVLYGAIEVSSRELIIQCSKYKPQEKNA